MAQDLAQVLAQPLLAGLPVATELGTFVLTPQGEPLLLPSAQLLSGVFGEELRRSADEYVALALADHPYLPVDGATKAEAFTAKSVTGAAVALKLVGEVEVGNLGALVKRVAYGEAGDNYEVVTFSPSDVFRAALKPKP